MKLPVDTSAIAFLCALEPQPLLTFDTKGSPRDKLDYGYGYAAAGRTV